MRFRPWVILCALYILTVVPRSPLTAKGSGTPSYRLSTARTAVTESTGLTRSVQVNGVETTPLIDGDKTPDQVPDVVAFRHFIMAAAVRAAATKEQRAAKDGYLELAGLSEADTAAIRTALGSVADDLAQVDRRAAAASSDPSEMRAAALQRSVQKTALLAAAETRLRAALSPDGASKLDDFVRTHVKSRIRIYGSGPQ